MPRLSETDVDKPVRHVWKGGGWRRHVEWYGMDMKRKAFIRCSEPNCEMNVRSNDA